MASNDPLTKKHRACDECRQRKLACSKSPEGCDRCMREKIVCHYSEQKPMGRPRKRQLNETLNGAEGGIFPHVQDSQHFPSLFRHEFAAYNDLETQLNFIASAPLGKPPSQVLPEEGKSLESERIAWHFGDNEIMNGPPINFGTEDVVASLPVGLAPQEPSVSNPPLVETESSTKQSVDNGNCSCLASMYLSLAALQQFPTEIVPALNTVRGAAATASHSISLHCADEDKWCPQCGSVILDTATPPIESFQNMMLLGTILPIIANGYKRLLKMVDDETDFATAAGHTKMFRLQDYGGLIERQVSIQQETDCIEQTSLFNGVEMPPDQWRTTVRALLRVDIYGHEQDTFKHTGLRDLVTQMEFRQRTRHEMLDAQEAAGTLDKSKAGHGWAYSNGDNCSGEKTHGCLEILKIAKIAIDNLVIA